MVVSTLPQCKLLHTTLMDNEVQRSKSFHTAVVQYYSVVGHSIKKHTNKGSKDGNKGQGSSLLLFVLNLWLFIYQAFQIVFE